MPKKRVRRWQRHSTVAFSTIRKLLKYHKTAANWCGQTVQAHSFAMWIRSQLVTRKAVLHYLDILRVYCCCCCCCTLFSFAIWFFMRHATCTL